MKDNHALSLAIEGVDRRKFMKRTGFASLGVAGSTFLGSILSTSPAFAKGKENQDNDDALAAGTLTTNDINILNFALNLEYLEAEYYTKATTGKTLSQVGIPVNGVGEEGPTIGGQAVNFKENDGENNRDEEEDAAVSLIARQIADDEQHHVLLLRSVLGNKAIAKPEINLNALGQVKNRSQFLAEARAFEDVGVSAYGAAAPLIQSKAILAVAARIALAEGEHVGNIRLLVALNDVKTMALDGKDILPPPSGKEFISVDQKGLTVVRTPSEVLAILYGSAKPGTNHGGFFPDGLNGAITTV